MCCIPWLAVATIWNDEPDVFVKRIKNGHFLFLQDEIKDIQVLLKPRNSFETRIPDFLFLNVTHLDAVTDFGIAITPL